MKADQDNTMRGQVPDLLVTADRVQTLATQLAVAGTATPDQLQELAKLAMNHYGDLEDYQSDWC